MTILPPCHAPMPALALALALALTACGEEEEPACEEAEGWETMQSAGRGVEGWAYTKFGQKLAALGDLDGDGYGDFAVIHWGVHIFYGPLDEDRDAKDADAILEIPETMGFPALAPVGDVDGDGYGDLVMGTADDPDLRCAYLLFGPFEGPVKQAPEDAVALYVGEGNHGFATDIEAFPSPTQPGSYGIAVGSPLPAGDEVHTRVVNIFHEVPSENTPLGEADAFLWQSAQDTWHEFMATSDTDGDGVSDYAVGAVKMSNGAARTGGVCVVLGPGEGDIDLADADAVLYGEEAGDWAGDTVADAGDVNADGYGDLLIGAPLRDNDGPDAGVVYVVLGPVAGARSLAACDGRIASPPHGRLGDSLDGAGDVNGDGFDDIVVGAPYLERCEDHGGEALVVLGPIEGSPIPLPADRVIAGQSGGDCAGTAVAGAGDVDGDGLADLLVGDPCWWNEYGRVTLVLGADL